MIRIPNRLSERLTMRDIEAVKSTLDTLVKMQEEMLMYVTKMVYAFYAEHGDEQLHVKEKTSAMAKFGELTKNHE